MTFQGIISILCLYTAYRTWNASTSPTATAVVYFALLSLLGFVWG